MPAKDIGTTRYRQNRPVAFIISSVEFRELKRFRRRISLLLSC